MTDITQLSGRAQLVAQLRRLRETHQHLRASLEIHSLRGQRLQVLTDALYDQLSQETVAPERREIPKFDGISFIISAYEMKRQLLRTLRSLTPAYQNAEASEIEIIVVDNGSSTPLSKADFAASPRVTKVLRVDGRPSPVFGLNQGIEEAAFGNVALMIDGAHMLSPGVFTNAKAVLQMMRRPVINIPQYLLGDISQNLRGRANAYEREEERLRALGWPMSGYALFQYAVVSGEAPTTNHHGWIESNCLITTKEVLRDCGGFDERFDEPGAGVANIELFARLRHHTENQYVIIPGEGTFHQDHSGTTTGVGRNERKRRVEQYMGKYESMAGTKAIDTARSGFHYGVVRKEAEDVPRISRDYGDAKDRILRQLARLYAYRAEIDQRGPIPSITFDSRNSEEGLLPDLAPLGLLDAKAAAAGVSSDRLQHLDLLRTVHSGISPNHYLEIGVGRGETLALASCPAIGVGPSCEIATTIQVPVRLFRIESDTFFANRARCETLFKQPIDLVYIAGARLAENMLRDFMNVEPWIAARGAIVIDGVCPEQLEMAEREARFTTWCGDAYKLLWVLQRHRPDLRVHVFESFAGQHRRGLAVVTGLDPTNAALVDEYEQIEASIAGDAYAVGSIAEMEERMPPTPLAQLEEILTARP